VTAVSWTFVSFDLLCFESMPGDVTSGNSTDCSQCRCNQSVHRDLVCIGIEKPLGFSPNSMMMSTRIKSLGTSDVGFATRAEGGN
jgi:hypothetical protein